MRGAVQPRRRLTRGRCNGPSLHRTTSSQRRSADTPGWQGSDWRGWLTAHCSPPPHNARRHRMLNARRIISMSGCSLAVLGGGFAASAATASADGFPPGGHAPVGHVYVNDNTTVANTVAAFERHQDGSLTALPGSPFAAGGAGSGKGLASQGALQVTPDGRYLLAVDAGSNEISVLRIGFNGVPQQVGAPVSSGGIDPNSVAVSGNLVYVENAGAGGTNVTGFYLAPWGGLYPLPHSTV